MRCRSAFSLLSARKNYGLISATVAAALAPEVQAAMLGETVFETRDADLAALARSLAEPGLKNRIADYVASLKRKGIAT